MINLTFSERESDGFATLLANGEETNVRVYLFTEEDAERLQSIQNNYEQTI